MSKAVEWVIGPEGARPPLNNRRFRGLFSGRATRWCSLANRVSMNESDAPESIRAGTGFLREGIEGRLSGRMS